MKDINRTRVVPGLLAAVFVGLIACESITITGDGCQDRTDIMFSPGIQWRGTLDISVQGDGVDEKCSFDFDTGRGEGCTELVTAYYEPLSTDGPLPIDAIYRLQFPYAYNELTLTIASDGVELYKEKLTLKDGRVSCDQPEHTVQWKEIEVDTGIVRPEVPAGGAGGGGGTAP